MEWNTNRAIKRLKKFAFPRLAGTKSLINARDIIYRELNSIVPNANIEEFSCRNELKTVLRFWGIIFIGLIIAIAFFWIDFFWISMICALTLILLNILAQGSIGRKQVFHLFKNRGSIKGYNIDGNISALEKEKKILVLGAHYDSKSSPSYLKKNEPIMIGSALLVNVAVIVLGILRFFISYTFLWWFIYILWIGSAIEFVSVIIYTMLYQVLNESPGVNDNGSGVAVILELAEIFSKKPLKYLTLAFSLFDAEEIGLQGSSAYVNFNYHKLQKRNAWMINFDEIAGGLPIKVILKGGFPTINYGKELAPIFQKVIQTNTQLLDLQKNKKLILTASSFTSQSDHAPFFTSSIPSAYIYTSNKKRHSANDDWEAFKSESIGPCGLLLEEFITTLDDELSQI